MTRRLPWGRDMCSERSLPEAANRRTWVGLTPRRRAASSVEMRSVRSCARRYHAGRAGAGSVTYRGGRELSQVRD